MPGAGETWAAHLPGRSDYDSAIVTALSVINTRTNGQRRLLGVFISLTSASRHAGLCARSRRRDEVLTATTRFCLQLDLTIDNALPQDKIKARLRKIQSERTSIEARLTATHAELAVGVEVLVNALDLLSDPQELHENGSDVVRRHLNQTFYQCFYLDIDGVKADQLNEPFAGLHEVGGTGRTFHQGLPRSPRPSRRSRNEKGGPTLSGVPKDPGSSKTTLVDMARIEPG